MNNQKNRFWTFCMSLVPGAGEMYLGLYHQGISLMLAFIALCILPLMLGVGVLMVFAVVVWFYSFLHTHNLRAMPLEEFCQVEDRWFWGQGDLELSGSFGRIAAIVLILVGAAMLWENLFYWIYWYLPNGPVTNIFRNLPEIAVGVLLLAAGVWLIRGKKRELDREEPTVETAVDPTAESVTETAAVSPAQLAAPAADGEKEDGHADA